MIVRRITAGAAGLALAGTAFAAAPAMAKSQTTLTLDAGLVKALTDGGVAVSAKSPAKMSGTKITFPAKMKGTKVVTHKGGISFKSAANTVTLVNLAINAKNGKVSAEATSPVAAPLADLMKVSGGKNKLKKKGTWTGATLKLANSFQFGGQSVDPAVLIGSLLGLPSGAIKTGATVGKIDIKA